MCNLDSSSNLAEIFSRQINFKDLGEEGQNKLLNTTVGIVGAGGLGSNVASILRSCGIGSILIIDGDKIEESNLPRQLYRQQDVGKDKALCLKDQLEQKYNFGQVITHTVFLNQDNIQDYLTESDIVLDCSDNLDTRLMVGRFTCDAKIPLISASVAGSDGQILSLDYKTQESPNLDSLVTEALKSKAENEVTAVLGCHVAVMASLQALEAINYIMYGSNSSLNTLIHIDLRAMRMLKLNLKSRS